MGPYQLRKFADSSNNEYGKTDYYRDPNALKLISQDEWECDRPMYDITNLNQPVGLERIDSNVRAQRTANYIRRMIPHVFGWFPMMAVWFILIVQLENAKRDIDEISDRNIPGWVESLIYGQFLIFTQFAFVQIVFQRIFLAKSNPIPGPPRTFTPYIFRPQPWVLLRHRDCLLHPLAQCQTLSGRFLAGQRHHGRCLSKRYAGWRRRDSALMGARALPASPDSLDNMRV